VLFNGLQFLLYRLNSISYEPGCPRILRRICSLCSSSHISPQQVSRLEAIVGIYGLLSPAYHAHLLSRACCRVRISRSQPAGNLSVVANGCLDLNVLRTLLRSPPSYHALIFPFSLRISMVSRSAGTVFQMS
jgi:hypothetical protein